ncbi:hypothetical protein MuYL_0212 [Mucilaginibacter xinganensis]|uniref:DUF4435 domain-containing protein n=2 Tax=Mucilaginibacter xinganensis TaxID=1234841 RepID=A0A223NQC3_9SPHI|nr:hypothetical protein MuYL_0212 [Mucilaginibacter xinganensis]
MNFLDSFFFKAESILPRAGNIRLLQHYNSQHKTIHVFVEDEDDFEFYRPFITLTYIDFKIIPYFQKGKKYVKEAYYEINWSRFIKSKVLFFTDKDYDDILGRETVNDINFFVTKHYSIENYLATVESFDFILSRCFGLKHQGLKQNLLDKFKNTYEIFQSNLLPITAFILIYRKDENHLKLDYLKMSYFFHFDELEIFYKKLVPQFEFDKTTKSLTIAKLEKLIIRNQSILEYIEDKCFADRSNFSLNKLLGHRNAIKLIDDPKKYIRGKYDIWFLLESFRCVERMTGKINLKIKEMNNSLTEHQQIPLIRKNIDLNINNVFDVLPPKINMPTDIRQFLTINLDHLNGNN